MGPDVGTDETSTLEGETVADLDPQPHHLRETLAGDTIADTEIRDTSGPYADTPAPSRIGRYLLLGILGSGGMGVVHSAYDPKLDRRIALKILHGGDSQSLGSRERLLREAQAMARLSHPNVVTVHDVGEHEGRVFVAMESIEGRTLTRWLADEKRSVREILAIFVEAGQGLAAAHDKGLVHRDFKPDNVMVGDDGRVRVMDFGLARPAVYAQDDLEPRETPSANAVGALENPVTVDGALVGTPMYMAPEQWRGVEVDARTDQFSFCVALYQALYRELPFEGNNLGALALSVTSRAPRPPSTTLSIPSAVVEGWQRGLSTESSARFPSMAPLLMLLRRDPARARQRGLAVGAGVVLLGLGGGAWFYQQSRELVQCEREASSVADVWGAGQRGNVEQAFLGSGVSYAADSLERVVPFLDGYADQWTDLRHDVCIDELEAEQRTPAQNELAIECLGIRKRELEALVSELERGTPSIVRDGIVAAANLPAVSRCVDEISLQERADGPSDPQQRDAIERVRERVSSARRRIIVADFDVAFAQATEALQEAESVGWPPLEARARLALADATYGMSRYTEAEAGYRDAFTLALASGHDSIAASAAGGIARILGVDRAHPEDGLPWVDIAQALNTRMGRESGDIHRLRGMLLTDAGDPRVAEEEMDRAVELDEARYGIGHPTTIVSLQTRCSVYSKRGRYDEALACLEQALELQTELLGPAHPTVGAAKNNIGSLHARTGELALGLAALQEALEIRERALGKDHVDVAKSLLNLGAITAMMGDGEAAEPLLVRAVEIFEKTAGSEDPTVARGLVNLAHLQVDRGDLVAARGSVERAVSIQETALGPDHPHLINSLSLLATLEGREGNLPAAEALHRRELAIAESQPAADPVPASLARINLAGVVSKLGRHDEARNLLGPALEKLTEKLGPNHPHIASGELGLAEVFVALDDPKAALEHARKALEIRAAALGPEHGETVTAREFVEGLASP